MIDVHCLRHNDEKVFFPQLLSQLQREESINLFVIDNGRNIGAGRVKGFSSGKSDYVSYVDYDDLIKPGIFRQINSVMKTGIPWCYTDEWLIDEDGGFIQPGWSVKPEIYSSNILEFVKIGEGEYCHHILTFRRELLTRKLIYIMKQLKELSEEYLRTELMQYMHKHINAVGYFWRQHKNNTFNNYECTVNLLEEKK